jgi:hypothetical protein
MIFLIRYVLFSIILCKVNAINDNYCHHHYEYFCYYCKVFHFLFFCPSLQENLMISQKTNFNDYYKSLRNNVLTFLEHNRLPPSAVESSDVKK